MFRPLAAAFVLALAGCQCGGPVDLDGGLDAGKDAGAADAGKDAGPVDGGDAGSDAGPLCTLEICDGLDNDCDGTVDLAPDAGPLTQLCPLQQGVCRGAKVSCSGGSFASCVPLYGAKYEEFESLCDGLDNDCSGFADVSLWRAMGEVKVSTDEPLAVSVPGGWYASTGQNARMFDEQLRPISEVFPIGRTASSDLVSSSAASFGGYLNLLFAQTPPPGVFLQRLNLDGTYVTSADGGPLEIELLAGHPAPLTPGALRVSNEGSTMLVAFSQQGAGGSSQEVLTLWPDGGTRAALTAIGDAGDWRYQSAPVGTEEFVVALPYPSRLQVQRYSADLVTLGAPVDLVTPADSVLCAISTQTNALDAGPESVLAVCPDARHLYAAENLFGAGQLSPFWETDAGTIANVRLLPSYARATVIWMHAHGASPTIAPSTIWMGQVTGQPVSIAELPPTPNRISVAPSIRGGYLLEAVFDGGQGVRPYGAYVCPL
jgi:hypothetical protein